MFRCVCVCVCVWTGGWACLESWQLNVTDDVSILLLQRDESERCICVWFTAGWGGGAPLQHTHTHIQTHTYIYVFKMAFFLREGSCAHEGERLHFCVVVEGLETQADSHDRWCLYPALWGADACFLYTSVCLLVFQFQGHICPEAFWTPFH